MNCKYCDTPITPVRASGRQPVYCSALCRKRSNRDQRDSNRDTESVTIDLTPVTIENAPVTIEGAPAKEILYCGCGAEAYGRLPSGYPSCIACTPVRAALVWPPP